jgi:hypothetical protein
LTIFEAATDDDTVPLLWVSDNVQREIEHVIEELRHPIEGSRLAGKCLSQNLPLIEGVIPVLDMNPPARRDQIVLREGRPIDGEVGIGRDDNEAAVTSCLAILCRCAPPANPPPMMTTS